MKKISLKKFIAHFGDSSRKEKRFCFILGAGASFSSGIPTGGQLVREWMDEIKEADEADYDRWRKDKKIKDVDLAGHYPEIFDKRFELSKKDGFEFLERKMEGIDPSCGYSVLAEILANGKHNIVITTNFDSLTEDALFIYTQKKPLVVGHSSLAGYISTNLSRPIIVKIHHDLLLSPKNSEDEVDKLDKNYSKNLKNIFKFYTPLVIGYGGNDGSLMSFLEDLDHIEENMFWFYMEGEKPKTRIVNLVEQVGGCFVPMKGFDELMVQIGDKLELKALDTKIASIANKRVDNYRRQVKKISNAETKQIDIDTKEAMSNIASRGDRNWWHVDLDAARVDDEVAKNDIYLKGLKEFPDSAALNGTYANFLCITKKFEEAEKYYREGLKLDAGDELIISNYSLSMGNYAKQLIISNKRDKALEAIKQSFKLGISRRDDFAIELWFYCFAIFPKEYPESKREIEKLLDQGAQSLDWDLSEILKIAKKEKHPDYALLVEFDKRITQPSIEIE